MRDLVLFFLFILLPTLGIVWDVYRMMREDEP